MTTPSAKQAFADAVRSFKAGDRAEALRLTSLAVDLDPQYADARLELARLLQAAGRPQDAEQTLRQGLADAPRHFGLLTNLGALLSQSGRAAEGAEWLQQARDSYPDLAAAHFNLANARKAGGDLDAAVTSYRDAIARDPDHVGAYGNLGNSLAELNRPAEAAIAYRAAAERRRRPGTPANAETFARTSASKLRHDIEQLDYLLSHGLIDAGYREQLAAYRNALAGLPPAAAGKHVVDLPPAHRDALAATYNRLWHKYEAPALAGGAVNALDRAGIETDYARNKPGITYVDNFLTGAAVDGLRRFCLESSIWYQFKYANGYLGGFWEDNFWCPLLAQVTEELRRALPGIFRDAVLRKCWAFKYDSRLSGIPIHADFAAVNVNFWITPDEANLDPDHGGLVVWDKESPADWDFADYNSNTAKQREFLASSGARSVTIPHRQNRVVIFNSDLFHETDRITFAEGYENRRINITLLYGTRHQF